VSKNSFFKNIFKKKNQEEKVFVYLVGEEIKIYNVEYKDIESYKLIKQIEPSKIKWAEIFKSEVLTGANISVISDARMLDDEKDRISESEEIKTMRKNHNEKLIGKDDISKEQEEVKEEVVNQVNQEVKQVVEKQIIVEEPKKEEKEEEKKVEVVTPVNQVNQEVEEEVKEVEVVNQVNQEVKQVVEKQIIVEEPKKEEKEEEKKVEVVNQVNQEEKTVEPTITNQVNDENNDGKKEEKTVEEIKEEIKEDPNIINEEKKVVEEVKVEVVNPVNPVNQEEPKKEEKVESKFRKSTILSAGLFTTGLVGGLAGFGLTAAALATTIVSFIKEAKDWLIEKSDLFKPFFEFLSQQPWLAPVVTAVAAFASSIIALIGAAVPAITGVHSHQEFNKKANELPDGENKTNLLNKNVLHKITHFVDATAPKVANEGQSMQ
jgi:hypothetical protein